MLPITTDEIAWVYRLFLGRNAAPQEVEHWRGLASMAELRERCLDSPEFRGIMQRRCVNVAEAPLPLLSFDLPPPRVEWQADPATQARLLDHVMRTWTALGHDRPHWSVLSSEAFLPERIEENRRAFYASGANLGDGAAVALAVQHLRLRQAWLIPAILTTG